MWGNILLGLVLSPSSTLVLVIINRLITILFQILEQSVGINSGEVDSMGGQTSIWSIKAGVCVWM
jgi:hypothetical protein